MPINAFSWYIKKPQSIVVFSRGLCPHQTRKVGHTNLVCKLREKYGCQNAVRSNEKDLCTLTTTVVWVKSLYCGNLLWRISRTKLTAVGNQQLIVRVISFSTGIMIM